MKRYIFAPVIGLTLLLGTSSFAISAPEPRIKPAPPSLSDYISADDATLLRKGLSYAERNKWASVHSIERNISDPVARDILRWHRAAKDPDVPITELTYVVQNLANWPGHVGIKAKAEKMMFDDPMPPNRTLEWFGETEPVSGEGRIVLARAYYATNQDDYGDLWLKSAWREARLTRSGQQEVFQRYEDHLTEEDHAARADHLIWLGRYHFSKAEALLPHMSKADRAVMDARMKLSLNANGMDRAIAAIPESRQTDPGFLFERARWRRIKRSNEYALPVYLEAQDYPVHPDGRERMWREKKLMAYWLISEKNYADAYKMTLNHGFSRGVGFADAEFLAGFLALRHLDQPEQALTHFQRLETGVTTPVSLSRAHYWQGRAHEAMGDGLDDTAYRQAADYPNTFYGQLATARLDGNTARITLPQEIVSADATTRFAADARVKAMHLLGEAGEERLFSLFSFTLDDDLESIEDLALLSRLAADYGFMRSSIRAAKQAGRFQSMLTDSGYPIVTPIEALGEDFDIPFVYAIARQESEFAANAISSASAYGMMQMISSTARATARRHNIAYDQQKLIADRDYAARMGALHLHDLLEDYDGSYILAAVGYNAGPTRVRQWTETYGDPRTGEIDPIDWLEMIPFSETRNYVQRVMENMQVYRARRDGDTAIVTVDEDIRFGSRHPGIR